MRYPLQEFDGEKFAARYGLKHEGDFWADTEFIYVRDGLKLPDDPPIFEAPGPLAKSLEQRVAELEVDVDVLKQPKPATVDGKA